MCDRIAAATVQGGLGLTLLPVHDQVGGCDGRPLGPGQNRFGTKIDQFAALMDGAAAAIAPFRPIPSLAWPPIRCVPCRRRALP
jgi:formimidoylglutamate deiminase